MTQILLSTSLPSALVPPPLRTNNEVLPSAIYSDVKELYNIFKGSPNSYLEAFKAAVEDKNAVAQISLSVAYAQDILSRRQGCNVDLYSHIETCYNFLYKEVFPEHEMELSDLFYTTFNVAKGKGFIVEPPLTLLDKKI